MSASSSLLSIVIPVFNRAWCVERALRSAQRFLAAVGGGEIIVVDDSSKDSSVTIITRWMSANTCPNIITRLVVLSRNRGVCTAKNAGAAAASGRWVIFLDSDDELVADSAHAVEAALESDADVSLHFFRSVGEDGVIVGARKAGRVRRGLADFVRLGTQGESLPVVRRETFLQFRYDEDINGFEGLCYSRIVRQLGPAILQPMVARRYFTGHEDRLSSRAGVRRRARSLARGYARLLREHGTAMGPRALAHVMPRFAWHGLRSLLR